MKSLPIKHLLLLFLVACLLQGAHAQQLCSPNYTDARTQPGGLDYVPPADPYPINLNNYQKTFINTGDPEYFTVVKGGSYKFNTFGTSFDTKLSGFNASTFSSAPGFGDDRIFQNAQDFDGGGAGIPRRNEEVSWIATFSGRLHLQVNTDACDFTTTSAVIRHKQLENMTVRRPEDAPASCGPGGSAVFLADAVIEGAQLFAGNESDDADFSYQWQVNEVESSASSPNWVNIADATSKRYDKSDIKLEELDYFYRYQATLGQFTKASPAAILTPKPLDPAVDFIASDDNCDGEIKFTWQWPSVSPERWLIEYTTDTSDNPTGWLAVADDIPGTKRTYTQTVGVTRGQIYNTRITAYDSNCAQFGVPSEPDTGISPDDPTAPSNIQTVIVDIPGGKAIDVSWEDNSNNEKGFIVERSLVSGGAVEKYEVESDAIQEATTGGVTVTFRDEDIQNCQPYKYRVYAYNACKPTGVRDDNDFDETIVNIDIASTINNVDALVGSKGYYTDRIELKWEVNQNSNINFVDRFRIYSRELGALDTPAFIASVDPELRTYDDERADAGVLFEYFIVGESDCGDSVIRSYDIKQVASTATLPAGLPDGVGYSIGYRSPSGIVNGNIAYVGGIAVPDVKVVIEKESGPSGKSLQFDGNDYVQFDHTPYLSPSGVFTLSAWLKPDDVASPATQVLVQKQDAYTLEIRNSSPYFSVRNAGGTWFTAFADSIDLVNGEFVSLFGVLANDSVKLFIDGKMKAGVPAVTVIDQNNNDLFFARSGANTDYYSGYLDEIRLYNIALDSNRILRDHGRIVDPGANDLLAYYQLNEGVGPYVFDAARTGRTFHANDGDIVGAQWSEIIPDGRQLGIAGFTNMAGNYSIPGVVYTGIGNNFTVTPKITLGGAIHGFAPGQKTIFIGEGSSVINEVDFEDVSSFRVTGSVLFDYGAGETGSPGVQFFIDGVQPVNDNTGMAVLTNDFGQFDIQVPIGDHTIIARKPNHVFANGTSIDDFGKFPTLTETFDFQEPQSGITFRDVTTRRLAGRVVGGKVEGDKPLKGVSDPSVNNIGTANFYLQSPDKSIEVLVFTDPVTGEYDTIVPPLSYTIWTNATFSTPGVNIPSNAPAAVALQDNPDIPKEVDLRNVAMSQYDVDTAFDANDPSLVLSIDSFEYNLKTNFVYRSVPIINVTNGEKGKENKPFDGEDFWVVTPKDGSDPDTLNLKDNSGDLVLPYPVFSRSERYKMRIALEEIYTNFDGGAGNEVNDTVRVSDARLNITNQIGKGFYTDASGSMKNYVAGSPGTNPDTLLLNTADGDTIYSFVAIEPDFLEVTSTGEEQNSFSKSIQITARAGGNVIHWPGPDPTGLYRGYVLGSRPLGTGIITKAPTQVDFILRDPPGGNSTASIETGQTISQSSSYSLGVETDFNLDLDIGVGQTTFLGLGAGVINEASTAATVGMSFSTTIGSGGTKVSTYEINETFSTNSEPVSVGAMSDVYVAKSENIRYGQSESLTLVDQTECAAPEVGCPFSEIPALAPALPSLVLTGKSGKTYEIARKIGFFIIPEGDPTFFVFSQDNILNVLIPDLISLRNTILLENPRYTIGAAVGTASDLFGANNDDPVWTSVGQTPSSTNYPFTDPDKDFSGPSYTFTPDPPDEIDSIRWFNQQIRLWKETIAKNEQEKVEAINGDYGAADNVTFSALSDLDRSVTITNSETKETSFELSIGMSAGTSVDIAMFGVDFELEISGGVTTNTSFTNENGEESSTTYAYTLSDSDQGDVLSIDVYESQQGNGPIFILKGGQTACPHEDLEATQFYMPGTKIGERTLQREKPTLDVDVPIIYNVPDDEEAVFTLTLGNESETQDGQNYALQLIESSNPNGAVLAVDGTSFSSSRNFFVDGGSAIQKTLTMKRGPFDFDYENIQVVLTSTCQYDPTGSDKNLGDTISLSAFFLPACTTAEILSPKDQWVVNSSFNDTLDISVGGFNINKAGFREVDLQYKPSTSSGWLRINKFLKDTAGLNDPTAIQIPRNNPTINYEWDVSQIADGTYDLRALTSCDVSVTNTTIQEESEIFSGLIDRVNPVPFGQPQPADGILSPGDEIMIQFNEIIDAGLLKPTNFDIRGVLNGGEVRNSASVFFAGTSNNYMEISEGINLTTRDFTLEFYVKPKGGTGKEVIVSQGENENLGLLLGLDEGNKVFMTLAGRTIVSNSALLDDKWAHVAVTYNREQTTAAICINAIPDVVSNSFVTDYNDQGKILIAKTSYSPEYNFTGNVHEFRIWNKALSEAEVSRFATIRLDKSKANLVGNWRMEEAQGTIAEDIIRSRNGLVFGTWQVEPRGKSMAFDGDDHITAPPVAFGLESDFTVEFWFRAFDTNTEPVTFIGNGRGDGTDSNVSGWSIGADNTGKLFFNNDGNVIEATSDGYFDNNWHHVALVMNRIGNTTFYVDGEESRSVNSSPFNSFGGPKFWIGARGTFEGAIEVVDQYLKGNIDEVRIWGTQRRANQIINDKNSKLMGDEPGLYAYYPFEEFIDDSGVLISVNSVNGQDTNGNTPASVLTLVGTPIFSDITTTIKQPRPVKAVNFTFTSNGDRIILSPNDPDSLLENVILDITVKNVRDLNNNVLPSPVTWAAFVDRNDVIWQDDDLTFDIELGTPLTFKSRIINQGGQVRGYSITNLPPWLTASPSGGILEPLSSQEITFEIREGINIGEYNQDIFVSTEFGFDERLSLNLNVFKTAPDWTVNPADFQFAMSVIGRVVIDDKFSRDKNDVLAAFVGNEVRGVANLRYVESFDNYQAFLQVYSNNVEGDTITYRIWNASEGKIHTKVVPSQDGVLRFGTNKTYGSASEPVIFDAPDILRNEYEMVKGWQWISMNLNSPEMSDVNDLFSGYPAGAGDQIKTQFEFDQYDPATGWIGSITNTGGLNNRALYKVKLSNPGFLNIEGAIIDPSALDINVRFGWNWISFVSQRNLNVNEALANLNPIVGDQIKSQRQFAIYSGQASGWIGNLEVLVPGQGFMLFSNATEDKVFRYPIAGILAGRTLNNAPDYDYLYGGSLTVDVSKYPNNMSLVMDIDNRDNQSDTLVAIINGEVRGVSIPQYNSVTNANAYFMTVFGESVESDSLHFAYKSEGAIIPLFANSAISYTNNRTEGSLVKPVMLYDKLQNGTSDLLGELVVMPNPFVSDLSMKFELTQDAQTYIGLYSMSGQRVAEFYNGLLKKGIHEFQWGRGVHGLNRLERGVYILKFISGSTQENIKVIKK